MRFAIHCVLLFIHIVDNIPTLSEYLLSLHHTFQPKRSQHVEKKIIFSAQTNSCDYSVMNVKRSTAKAGNNLWHKCQIGPRFSRLVRTDVMGRLPKHLIVDTVQWDYNTDLHDGCQIKTNPAMVFTSFEFMHGGRLSGARDDVDARSHCLSRFYIPPPLYSFEASHLLSSSLLPIRLRI